LRNLRSVNSNIIRCQPTRLKFLVLGLFATVFLGLLAYHYSTVSQPGTRGPAASLFSSIIAGIYLALTVRGITRAATIELRGETMIYRSMLRNRRISKLNVSEIVSRTKRFSLRDWVMPCVRLHGGRQVMLSEFALPLPPKPSRVDDTRASDQINRVIEALRAWSNS